MNTIIVVPRQANQSTEAAARIQSVDYFIAGDTLVIASASTIGRLYVVTASECSCEAGRQELPCWHAAARLHLFSRRDPIPTGTSNTED